jgi:hypothetical protein
MPNSTTAGRNPRAGRFLYNRIRISISLQLAFRALLRKSWGIIVARDRRPRAPEIGSRVEGVWKDAPCIGLAHSLQLVGDLEALCLLGCRNCQWKELGVLKWRSKGGAETCANRFRTKFTEISMKLTSFTFKSR